MAYLTAMLLIDAPASALNNSGLPIDDARTDNTSSVKFIRKSGVGKYPYFTAQAYRRWLRQTIELDPQGWAMSPIYREDKVAYTDSNPLLFWDDDLLGYMRAPGKESKKAKKDTKDTDETPVEPKTALEGSAITRISPLRVSTFVAIAPVNIVDDFGVMSRQEGNPAPFEHQFYRATFQGLLSFDLANAGTFTYSRRAGYQNLDSIRTQQAKDSGLEHIPQKLAYRLPIHERVKRVRRLIEAIPLVQGGAKQTLHYTDTTPVVTIAAVTKYGNHPFNFLFDEKNGQFVFNTEAFVRTLYSIGEQLHSPVYIGWKPGFAIEQEEKLTSLPDEIRQGLTIGTPIDVYQALSTAVGNNPQWLD
jgi:CRISPR-associated protein Cst2